MSATNPHPSYTALIVRAGELNRQICALPAGHPRILLLQADYETLQNQIRALRTQLRQAWL